LFIYQGGRVVSVPVSHRPRVRGRSHYGIRNRLFVGVIDLAGVIWLRRRTRITEVEEQGDGVARPISVDKNLKLLTDKEPAWNTIRSG
jgi:hypothetical protein